MTNDLLVRVFFAAASSLRADNMRSQQELLMVAWWDFQSFASVTVGCRCRGVKELAPERDPYSSSISTQATSLDETRHWKCLGASVHPKKG